VTASGGIAKKAIKVRDAALETAKTTLARVRFHYCSASRDADKTPELAKLDFQPRRMPGKAEKKPNEITRRHPGHRRRKSLVQSANQFTQSRPRRKRFLHGLLFCYVAALWPESALGLPFGPSIW
jgi:hypothetical protein